VFLALPVTVRFALFPGLFGKVSLGAVALMTDRGRRIRGRAFLTAALVAACCAGARPR
jgi:hypothetical protein